MGTDCIGAELPRLTGVRQRFCILMHNGHVGVLDQPVEVLQKEARS